MVNNMYIYIYMHMWLMRLCISSVHLEFLVFSSVNFSNIFKLI